MNPNPTLTIQVLSSAWIEGTDANAAWWASEMVGKPVLIDSDPDRRCGVVKEAWISESGDVLAEVELDPSVYDAAVDQSSALFAVSAA